MTEKAKKRMGESPLDTARLGIFESTLTRKAEPASPPSAVPVSTDQAPTTKSKAHGTKKEAKPAVKKSEAHAPGAGKQTKPAKKTAVVVAEETNSSVPSNPFGYDLKPTWPLVGYEKPFLVPLPEGQGRGAAGLSIRIPLDLSRTIELHCAKLGISNFSEWAREAFQLLLALEQQNMANKKG